MFQNTGKKIKALSKVICVLGITLSSMIGLLFIFHAIFGASTAGETIAAFLIGICILVFGSLCSWLFSLFPYSYGILIEKVQLCEYHNHNIAYMLQCLLAETRKEASPASDSAPVVQDTAEPSPTEEQTPAEEPAATEASAPANDAAQDCQNHKPRFCTGCGAELEEGFAFCTKCGTKI